MKTHIMLFPGKLAVTCGKKTWRQNNAVSVANW